MYLILIEFTGGHVCRVASAPNFGRAESLLEEFAAQAGPGQRVYIRRKRGRAASRGR